MSEGDTLAGRNIINLGIHKSSTAAEKHVKFDENFFI